eukprot:m.66661 g.66661  ORF g.66661 m.66661 type:complete len:566 (-) comp12653_c0_seq3:238-1935(-)
MASKKVVASLDVGTTGARCVLVDHSSNLVANEYVRLEPLHPQPGWSELDPEQLFEQCRMVISQAIRTAGLTGADVAALGISTLRGSFVTWSRSTGQPLHRIITWQDTRSAAICKQWNKKGSLKVVHCLGSMLHCCTSDRTGRFQAMKILNFDTQHSSGRLHWVIQNTPAVRDHLARNDLMFGTVDTWLVYKLTGGAVHATDFSSASATGLYDFYVLDWSQFVLDLTGIPRTILPELRATNGDYGSTVAGLFGASIPIRAVVGDQQSSLFGHCCFDRGQVKCSLGTGSFFCVNTGNRLQTPKNYSLYPMIAWKIGEEFTYMLEGSASCTGTAVDWGCEFGLYKGPADADALARSVPDSGGAVFVNAFHGLSAPYFDGSARGSIMGMSTHTRPAHVTRALLESIAFRFMDLHECMVRELPAPAAIRVDGGVAKSSFVLEAVSTLSGARVQRSSHAETTALGAAYLAGLAVGYWQSQDDLRRNLAYHDDVSPEPAGAPALRAGLRLWREAVKRACKWPAPPADEPAADPNFPPPPRASTGAAAVGGAERRPLMSDGTQGGTASYVVSV